MSGLTRLVTVRVSRASADQRRGRAGRTEPGVCYRLWDEPQTASLDATNTPEILAADLSGFVLDLAHWGVTDPAALAFLDAPPQPAIKEAKALLESIGAIDARWAYYRGGPTAAPIAAAAAACAHGDRRVFGGVAMLAAEIALVLTERGLGGNDVDLTHRLDGLRRDRSRRANEARTMARRWAEIAGARGGEKFVDSQDSEMGGVSPGALVALAYPDRVAKNRGAGGVFLLANGRGANIDPASALAREPFLAVAEIAGTAAQGRIMLAAPITLADIENDFADRIEGREDIAFDDASASLRGRRSRRFGALALSEQTMKIVPDDDTARMLAQGIARLGSGRLPWNEIVAAVA